MWGNKTYDKCHECGGDGFIQIDCPKCNGTGEGYYYSDYLQGYCGKCNGDCKIEKCCGGCGGSGTDDYCR